LSINIHYPFIFQLIQNCISYNVTGNWRFASPNRGLRSKTRAGKMWWSKTVQRAQARTWFCVARTARSGRYAVTDCYVAVLHF